ncbi:uncharacterized protein LOC112571151 [Pomacea canaliculata]|uniref:uncharacterized protein LOC112571151 n=1 Tax=Pomacea canaliculata TaxID=400727 RepID=UPI000D7369B0|nr:uncharacterized protein LOC112571151 [Pomacea canaliculata]
MSDVDANLQFLHSFNFADKHVSYLLSVKGLPANTSLMLPATRFVFLFCSLSSVETSGGCNMSECRESIHVGLWSAVEERRSRDIRRTGGGFHHRRHLSIFCASRCFVRGNRSRIYSFSEIVSCTPIRQVRPESAVVTLLSKDGDLRHSSIIRLILFTSVTQEVTHLNLHHRIPSILSHRCRHPALLRSGTRTSAKLGVHAYICDGGKTRLAGGE